MEIRQVYVAYLGTSPDDNYLTEDIRINFAGVRQASSS